VRVTYGLLFSGFARRHLTCLQRGIQRCRDWRRPHLAVDGGPHGVDKDHPVRHRMWRAYVNGSQTSQLVRRHLVRPARQFWQRGRRGWCDEDSFAIDGWLSRMMPDMLDAIRKREIGWPGEPLTFRSGLVTVHP